MRIYDCVCVFGGGYKQRDHSRVWKLYVVSIGYMWNDYLLGAIKLHDQVVFSDVCVRARDETMTPAGKRK